MMAFIASVIEPNLKFFYLRFKDHGVIEHPSFEYLFVTLDLSECQLFWSKFQQ